MGFERIWLPKLSASNPALEIFEWTAVACEHTHHDHAEHEDLHRWLDIAAVEEAGVLLAEQMTRLDPAGAALYAKNSRAFSALCAELKAELKDLFEPHQGRRFYVYHGAFGYFAEAFGLEQVALESEGREPSLRGLSNLITTARADGARFVYIQPQIQAPSAQRLAEAIGAELIVLDPLAEQWASNLRSIAQTMADGFAAAPKSKE